MTQTTISVAMCCSQGGERYVGEQVRSILRQRRPPDELVISDDASTDATLEVAEEAAAEAAFPVKVLRNSASLGAAVNFQKAISQAEGDVIALSDQDDVWAYDRLAVMEEALAERPAAGAVFSDAELVDQDLRPLGATVWQAIRFTPSEQRRFPRGGGLAVLMRRNVVGGATMAFRAGFRDLILPIPPTGLHDIWIAVLLAAVSEVALIPTPLMLYRQHGANEVGAGSSGLYSQLVARAAAGDITSDEIAHFLAARERLLSHLRDEGHPAVRVLDAKLSHLRARANLPGNRLARTGPILRELVTLKYSRYSRGWRSCAFDFLFRQPATPPA